MQAHALVNTLEVLQRAGTGVCACAYMCLHAHRWKCMWTDIKTLWKGFLVQRHRCSWLYCRGATPTIFTVVGQQFLPFPFPSFLTPSLRIIPHLQAHRQWLICSAEISASLSWPLPDGEC